MSGENKPVAVFRAGAIRAAIWSNEITRDGQSATTYSISISRSYKAGDQWKETSSYSTNDLPRVALVASLAFQHLALKGEEVAAAKA